MPIWNGRTARTNRPDGVRRGTPTHRCRTIPLLGTPAPEGTLNWSDLTSDPTEPVFEQVPF
ncbi:hypothetical protein ACFXO2_17160, partial [Streptomyces sp. NPDC059152]|uniref:hypothetical protein n=1 Tax=Streptomyces sp. NPDC059152 TaxID=3346742 RepID=UPI0036B1052D